MALFGVGPTVQLLYCCTVGMRMLVQCRVLAHLYHHHLRPLLTADDMIAFAFFAGENLRAFDMAKKVARPGVQK